MTTRFSNFDELRRARDAAHKAAWHAADYLEHRDKYLASAAASYATHRDEILAAYDPAKRAAVHVSRREADAAYGKVYRAAHAEERRIWQAAYDAAYRAWLRSITAQCLCILCGANFHIQAAEVVANISDKSICQPSYTQAIALAPLEPKQQREVARTIDFSTTATRRPSCSGSAGRRTRRSRCSTR